MSTEITPTAHLHLHINLNDVTAIFSFNYFKMGKLSYTSDSLFSSLGVFSFSHLELRAVQGIHHP